MRNLRVEEVVRFSYTINFGMFLKNKYFINRRNFFHNHKVKTSTLSPFEITTDNLSLYGNAQRKVQQKRKNLIELINNKV
jgi:hypothetical protein